MKVYRKWHVPFLKWYQRLFINLTPTEVKETPKHLVYTKKIGGMVLTERVKK